MKKDNFNLNISIKRDGENFLVSKQKFKTGTKSITVENTSKKIGAEEKFIRRFNEITGNQEGAFVQGFTGKIIDGRKIIGPAICVDKYSSLNNGPALMQSTEFKQIIVPLDKYFAKSAGTMETCKTIFVSDNQKTISSVNWKIHDKQVSYRMEINPNFTGFDNKKYYLKDLYAKIIKQDRETVYRYMSFKDEHNICRSRNGILYPDGTTIRFCATEELHNNVKTMSPDGQMIISIEKTDAYGKLIDVDPELQEIFEETLKENIVGKETLEELLQFEKNFLPDNFKILQAKPSKTISKLMDEALDVQTQDVFEM